jgi:hypothetical protein
VGEVECLGSAGSGIRGQLSGHRSSSSSGARPVGSE